MEIHGIELNDQILKRAQFIDYSETPQSPSSTSTTVLNIENGNHKSIYDLEESDEDEAFSHLRKPLIKKEK